MFLDVRKIPDGTSATKDVPKIEMDTFQNDGNYDDDPANMGIYKMIIFVEINIQILNNV